VGAQYPSVQVLSQRASEAIPRLAAAVGAISRVFATDLLVSIVRSPFGLVARPSQGAVRITATNCPSTWSRRIRSVRSEVTTQATSCRIGQADGALDKHRDRMDDLRDGGKEADQGGSTPRTNQSGAICSP
jgi:hypothetical protein